MNTSQKIMEAFMATGLNLVEATDGKEFEEDLPDKDDLELDPNLVNPQTNPDINEDLSDFDRTRITELGDEIAELKKTFSSSLTATDPDIQRRIDSLKQQIHAIAPDFVISEDLNEGEEVDESISHGLLAAAGLGGVSHHLSKHIDKAIGKAGHHLKKKAAHHSKKAYHKVKKRLGIHESADEEVNPYTFTEADPCVPTDEIPVEEVDPLEGTVVIGSGKTTSDRILESAVVNLQHDMADQPDADVTDGQAALAVDNATQVPVKGLDDREDHDLRSYLESLKK